MFKSEQKIQKTCNKNCGLFRPLNTHNDFEFLPKKLDITIMLCHTNYFIQYLTNNR